MRTGVDLNVPKDASRRDLSNATLRLGLALGVRRRRARKVAKNSSALGSGEDRGSGDERLGEDCGAGERDLDDARGERPGDGSPPR